MLDSFSGWNSHPGKEHIASGKDNVVWTAMLEFLMSWKIFLDSMSLRVKTAIRSFLVIRNLSPEQVERFMRSYEIYELDWAQPEVMEAKYGADYHVGVSEHLAAYYSVLNHLCAIGEVEKMYIPPVIDLDQSVFQNQILYERTVASTLGVSDQKQPKLLELGCGRGRVAAHIATIVPNAQVTGINIDADQIASAKTYNRELALENTFICRDFNDLPLPFPDNHFDGFYQIQAFSLVKDIGALCKELDRVLKPGAKLSLLDWASLPAYDPEDDHHQLLMRRIKPLIGAVGTPTTKSLENDLQAAGFEITRSENASVATQGLQTPLIRKADSFFFFVKTMVLSLVWIGLLPAHFRTLFLRLTRDCDALIEADSNRLVTMSYQWSARKPMAHEGLATIRE